MSAKSAFLTLVLLAPIATVAQDWTIQPVSILTRCAASVSPANAWPEYPRPLMARPTWQNLNGLWRYAITAKDAAAPDQYAGHILVPYPLESALSGVKNLSSPINYFDIDALFISGPNAPASECCCTLVPWIMRPPHM